jgi:hypothetical protein
VPDGRLLLREADEYLALDRAVGPSQPFVLAQVFCSGIHQERFDVSVRFFHIPDDAPGVAPR